MNYWLVKCEPSECSFSELKKRPNSTGFWRGVRNYQARNLIRDTMKAGDSTFFYHSSCDEPGIAGIAEITRAGYPDPSQFDPEHRYFDAKSSVDDPRWFSFDVRWKQEFSKFLHLRDLKANAALQEMRVVKRGQRLSIQPVEKRDWNEVLRMGTGL